MGLPVGTWIKQTIQWVETHWLSGKEKAPGPAVIIMSIVFKDMKGLIIYFLEKNAAIYIVSYSQRYWQNSTY